MVDKPFVRATPHGDELCWGELFRERAMLLLTAGVLMILAGAAEERTVAVIQASDSPIRLEHAAVLSASDGPPVLLYAATNLTNDPFDQFTVVAFIFRADGTLKARQLAPGRRTLDAHETKYSTMV